MIYIVKRIDNSDYYVSSEVIVCITADFSVAENAYLLECKNGVDVLNEIELIEYEADKHIYNGLDYEVLKSIKG